MKNIRNEEIIDCKPEILYSWGSLEKAENILKNLRDSNNWNHSLKKLVDRNAIYTALTPASTIFYGEIPLRIKLKKDITYRYIAGFESWSNPCLTKVRNKTVYVYSKPIRGVGMTYEVILCSADVIHSISLFSKRHYDETLKDLYILSKLDKGYSYIQGISQGKIEKMLDINFDGSPILNVYKIKSKKFLGVTMASSIKIVGIEASKEQLLDGASTLEEDINRHMEFFYAKVQSNMEEIIINPDINENPESHFLITEPLMFH